MVVGLDVAASIENFLVTQRTTRLELRFGSEFFVAKNGIPDESDACHCRASRYFGDQLHAIAHWLRKPTHIVHFAGLIKFFDIGIELFSAIGLPCSCAEEAADGGFINSLRSTILNLHIGDILALEVHHLRLSHQRSAAKDR